MKKNILVVLQDFPYPLHYAGPIDSLNKIKALLMNGFSVYLVATVKERVPIESINIINEFCVQAHVFQRSYSIKNFFSLFPFQVKSRINGNEIDKICLRMKGINFDAIICDGYYGIEVSRKISKLLDIKNVYLRVNNDESSYYLSLARSSNNFLKKIYYITDAVKFYIHERFFLSKIDLKGFLHVSYDEKKKYEIRFPQSSHFFLPAAIDVLAMSQYVKHDNRQVLFVGSLFMPNNIEGLLWYIKNIHDDLTDKYHDYILVVSGNTRGSNFNQLEKILSSRKNISFIDSPEDLTSLYRASMVFINPMLNGAGVKLKTLNAICAGLPVVSTVVGNEGTGLVHGEHIMVAKDKISFYEHIVFLMEKEKIRENLVINGQSYLAKTYNQSIALQKIFNETQTATSSISG